MHSISHLLVYCLLSMNLITHSILAEDKLTNISDQLQNQPATSQDLYDYYRGNLIELLEDSRDLKQAWVVAHRAGFAPGIPENSLEALGRSMASSPVLIEFDVMASADGVNLLMHDSTLDRTTTGSGDVESKNWSYLSQLKLVDQNNNSTTSSIPLFTSALELVQGHAFMILDIKTEKNTGKIIDELINRNMIESTAFVVYTTTQAENVRAKAPNAILALGVANMRKMLDGKTQLQKNAPYIALMGAFDAELEFRNKISSLGYYILAGSYIGENSVDSRLGRYDSIPELDQAGKSGIQLIVSNRPIEAATYMDKR